MRKFLRALFTRNHKPQSNALVHIPGWTPLGREEICLHIADASSQRARQGWAEAKRLRPDWRVVP